MPSYITIIGLIGATLTTIAYFPQALKIYKTKETHALSLGMFLIVTAGMTMWLTYGLLIHDPALIFANSISVPISIYILIMKIKHG